MSPQTNDLYTALQWHLPWHKARVKFVASFILALLQVTTVNLIRIANGLNGQADKKSNYRRIQRFFALFEIDSDQIAQVIVALLPAQRDWLVSLDRTHGQFGQVQINILLVGLVFQGVSFPLYWTLLPKKGNSNTPERIVLMEQVIQCLGKDRIRAVVGDREFIGQQWFKWLDENGLTYHMRIKENAVLPGSKPQPKVRTLFCDLPVDHSRCLRKRRWIYGQSVFLAAVRLDDEYLIVASNKEPTQALARYQKRWSIEVLFSALKKRGFDFEQTHLTDPQRIKKLVALLAIAFTWAHWVGVWLAEKKPLKIKKHGYKEQSLFRYGLDHLQYLLLNIQQRMTEFYHCVWLLICPPETQENSFVV
jgi:hypothetical protein